MFFIIEDTDIAGHVDDNTQYVSAGNIDMVIKSLEDASEILFGGYDDDDDDELFLWYGLPKKGA